MGDALNVAGYRVWEALAVSEVLHLIEHQRVDAVVIAPDVTDPDIVEVQLREITLRLKMNATPADVLWELAQLFPDRNVRLQ